MLGRSPRVAPADAEIGGIADTAVELHTIHGATSEAASGSSGSQSSYAWSDSFETGFWKTSYSLMQRTSYSIATQSVPRWLTIISGALELLSLLCVPVSLTLSRSTLGYGKGLAQIPRYIRDGSPPTEVDRLALGYALIAALGVVLVAIVFEFMMLRRGSLGHQRIFRFVKCAGVAVRGLLLAAGGAFMGLMFCRPGALNEPSGSCNSGQATARVGIGAAGLCLLVIFSSYDSLFHTPIIPLKSRYAQSTTRIALAMWVVKAALIGLDALGTNRLVAHCIVNSILLGGIAAAYVVFMPFYLNTWNIVYAGATAAATWASIVSIAAAAIEPNTTVVPLAICLGGIVPAAICSAVFTYLRILQYKRKFHAETPPLAYMYQVDLTLRCCFNQSHADPLIPEKAMRIIGKAKEQFPESCFSYILHGIILLEICNDPRGTVVHCRAAKRLDALFDLHFVTSCFVQFAHETMQEDSGKKDVEVLLDSVLRHHKLAKASAARFWQELVRSRENADTTALLKIVTAIDEHDRKAYGILTALLRKYPTNFKILRQYARFMSELRNDRESANQAYIMADQCEEEAASKLAKAVGKNKPHFGGDPVNESHDAHNVRFGAEQEETGTSDHENSLADTRRNIRDEDNSDAKSFTSSIMSSASSIGSDEQTHFRTIKRRIESAKSAAIERLHMGIAICLAILLACIIVEYQTSTNQLSLYIKHLDMMNKSIGCKQDLFGSLFYSRKTEVESLITGNLTSYCTQVSVKTRSVETSFDYMFQKASVSSSISAFWGDPSNLIRFWVPGTNKSDYWNGTYKEYYFPLWDAGYTIVNNLNEFCNPFFQNSTNITDMRTNTVFRILMDNGPHSIAKSLQSLGSLFAKLVTQDNTHAKKILYIMLPLTFSLCTISLLAIWMFSFRGINRDRDEATKLFYDIPKSAMINVVERLTNDKDRDEVSSIIRKSGLPTASLVRIEVVAGMFIMFGLVAAVFGVVLNFSLNHSSVGITINAAGQRRNLLGAIRYWAYELAVNDKTTGNFSTHMGYLETALDQFDKVDADLKYGNSSEGIVSYIREDTALYDLWYTRECPSELNLTDCYGIGTLIRRCIDEIKLFAASSQELITVDNSHLKNALIVQETTVAWLLEGISYILSSAIDAEKKTQSSIQSILAVSVISALCIYFLLRIGTSRLSTEIERLYKMLLFVPPTVLDGVPSIKDFIESGNHSGGSKNEAAKTQEQQTKNILDACEDAVVVCGSHGVIEIFNPAAERITGFAAEDALGRNVSMLLPEDLGNNQKIVQKIFRGNNDHAVADKKIASQEVVIRTKDTKEFTSLLSVSKSTVRGKTTYALFIRDITALKEHEQAILIQQRRAEALLCNILPKALVKQLSTEPRSNGAVIAQGYEEVTILFADIVGFTQMSSTLDPEELVLILNTLVSEWDRYAVELNVEKIKTIGDCYMAATGVPVPFPEHAEIMLEFALAMLETLYNYNKSQSKNQISIRVGVHTGGVVAGVLGLHKIAYDLWGESVTIASRMESSGFPNRIQLSETTFAKLRTKGYQFEQRGKVSIKGHGDIECYLLDPVTVWGGNEPPAPNLSHSMRSARLKKKNVSQASVAPAEFQPVLPHQSGMEKSPDISLSKQEPTMDDDAKLDEANKL